MRLFSARVQTLGLAANATDETPGTYATYVRPISLMSPISPIRNSSQLAAFSPKRVF